MASGVVTLPMRDTQRFDSLLSRRDTLAALRASGNPHLIVDAIGDDLALVVVQLPHERFDASILGLGVSALDALVEDGFTLTVGSGFVSVFNPVSPLGLLQLRGKVESEPTPHGYTRILGSRAAGLSVIARRDYHPGLFESAIQVGPGIVESGRLDILRRERDLPPYIRAVVAVCADRWLAAVAQSPMHLYDVGERLLGYFDAQGLRCDEVVNLSGDREALLAIRSEEGKSVAYFGNPMLPKASLVAFRAR